MPSEYRKGYVYIQNQYAGVVAETEEGYTFSYDNEYRNKENAVAVEGLSNICYTVMQKIK